MPPRYAYWTILIDNAPTAFRAAEKADLLPTLTQLRRTNKNVEMKWFARGRLWDTPEQAQWAGKHLPATVERRGRDWRPGGSHKDPRARFDKKKMLGRPKSASRDRTGESREQRRGHKPAIGPSRTRGEKGQSAAHRPWARKPKAEWRAHDQRKPQETVPPHRRDQPPEAPPAPEQIVIKPKPPERG